MNWKQTPLSKFGYKCIMNRHEICVESICECLCHNERTRVTKTC